MYKLRLEEVDCFNFLVSQVATDGGCERDGVIIIYHDFLPTPRRGSHVKSG